jgi:hypothetical protein
MGTQTVIAAFAAGFKAELLSASFKHLGHSGFQKVDLFFHSSASAVEKGDEGKTRVGILEDDVGHFGEFGVGGAVGFVTREDEFRTS